MEWTASLSFPLPHIIFEIKGTEDVILMQKAQSVCLSVETVDYSRDFLSKQSSYLSVK
jgi:hypothetical protein